MWMVECNDHGNESKMTSVDPMFGRRLRPLMPRPISSSNSSTSATFPSTLTTPCFRCSNNPNTSALHGMSGLSDYVIRRGINPSKDVPLVSTRWNPTPEQLLALEEMYKRGTRTPTAEQIQHIAGKLRRFGKIEGKNVFYWFQNHKARERQKKRRQLELFGGKIKSTTRHFGNNNSSETKRTGLSSRYNEFEQQNKNLASPSTCNKSNAQETVLSMQCSVTAECNNEDERRLLDQKELQPIIKKNSTAKCESNHCMKLDLSSSSYLPACKNAFTATAQVKSKLFGSMLILSPNNDDNIINVKENHDQTLQLFPVRSSDLNSVEVRDVSCVGRKFMPSGFIEFLPTKS